MAAAAAILAQYATLYLAQTGYRVVAIDVESVAARGQICPAGRPQLRIPGCRRGPSAADWYDESGRGIVVEPGREADSGSQRFEAVHAGMSERKTVDRRRFGAGTANRPDWHAAANQGRGCEMELRVGGLMSCLAVLAVLSLWGATLALSQTLTLNDRTAIETGEPVSFTLSLENPSGGQDVDSLTIDVEFDATVLTYDGYTAGPLVANWRYFDVNDPQNGLLKIAGFDLQGIPPSSSGAVVELHFSVAGGNDTALVVTSLDGFATRDGELLFEPPPMNQAPVATDDMGTTVQGQAVTVDVLANDNDGDGDSLAVASATGAGNGDVRVAADGASVTYTPEPGFTGTDEFTYTVGDGQGGTDTATVVVIVTAPPAPANQAPLAADDEAETGEGIPVTVRVLVNDTDADGDSLTITDATDGNYGSVEIAANGASVTYTPSTGFAGEDEFMYTAADGKGGTDTATVLVDVAEADDGDGDGAAVSDDGDEGGGGCALNPGAPFDPTLMVLLGLPVGVHLARRFSRQRTLP